MKRKLARLAVALPLVAAPAVVLAAAPASAVQGTLSGTTSPIGQTNATVWSLAYSKGASSATAPATPAVYAVGDFTTVRASGAAAAATDPARQYMAAWKASDGSLLPFSHTFAKSNADGTTSPVRPSVVAASPDGARIYIGGEFTQVDGQPRGHVAAFNTSDGSLVSTTAGQAGSWPVAVGAKVTAIAVSPDSSTVYLAGQYGFIKGTTPAGQQTRKSLGAVSSTGAVLPWGASEGIDSTPYSMTVAGSRVLLAGAFSAVTVNGTAVPNTYSAASLDATTGAVQTDFANGAHSAIPPKTTTCGSVTKDIVTDGTKAYFANEGTGGGCFDGTFAANLSNGSLAWKNGCLGATQAIAVVGNFLYKGSHAHDCQLTNPNGDPDNYPQVAGPNAQHLLAQSLTNGFLGAWYPDTNGQPLGPRAMATDGTNLWVGGDFTSVNNKAQQGIAAFKPGDTRPFAPTVGATSPRPGQVVVSVRAPLDLDDTDLTIKVYRGSPTTGTLLQTSTVHSLFWKQPVLKVVDATPGTGTQTYSATATEVNAPNTVSPTGTTTVAVAATTPSYVNAVLATNPSSYWRLDDASSTIAADSSTASAGSAGIYSRTGARTPGATTVADNATTFAGTQDQYGQGSTVYSGNVVPATVNTATSSYSIEAWFKTTSTSGGEIIDFGNRPTALSSTFERNIYLDNAGHVIFGTWIGSPVTISSLAKAKTYNNGQWHHVVATQGTGGMALYVDNLLIGTNTNARHTSYAGYWRIGGDNLTNWPSKPTSQYLNGAIDEVAVYPTALTAAQVAAHWTAR